MGGALSIRWVVQSNLLAENDIERLHDACERCGAEFESVQVIPFSEELPKFTLDEKVNIYYGSTTFIERVDKMLNFPKGVFFCSKAFQMDNYIQRWGVHMLNAQAKVTTLGECHGDDLKSAEYFVRPVADDKSFAGEVMLKDDLLKWVERVRENEISERAMGNPVSLDLQTPILVAPAYRVEKEWRNFIVDGKVIASTLYRKDHKLNKLREAPQEMLDFVHARCEEYVPHRIFVMDIALCGNSYYIIECGCLNSAGFYVADIDEIVKIVSQAMR
jgi:hypothetical protein